jgi:hypothetical protein
VQALEGWFTKRDDPERRAERLSRLLQRQVRVHGPDGVVTAECKRDLAEALEAVGRFPEAIELRREIAESYRLHLGKDDLRTLDEEVTLSYLLWRSGQVGDAVDLLKSVHARLSRTFGADHENTKTAQQALDRMRRATPPSATVSVPLFSVSTGRVRPGGSSGTSVNFRRPKRGQPPGEPQ